MGFRAVAGIVIRVGMKEDKRFLSEQIITYIGNKRLLIPVIEKEVLAIKKELGKVKLACADLFAGSGIVGRMLKQHSSVLYANDLEVYSEVVNCCYLSNKNDFPHKAYQSFYHDLQEKLKTVKEDGIIYQNYAPKELENIRRGERVFYTPENAKIIDTVRAWIEELPAEMQKYFLAPLLYEASVHVNTGGIFKGFYKDTTTGIGKFGGTAENALTRILGKINIKPPVLSRFESEIVISRMDANQMIKTMPKVDVIYLDPPYNQHPYGSNYFMLNVIAENKIAAPVSKVSGIPNDWNRSAYNKKKQAAEALGEMLEYANADYLLISYNSEGFISKAEMTEMLQNYGKVNTIDIKYNTYRASRNLSARKTYVKEYLFKLQKR